jgi:hypothetical protein
MHGVNYSKTAFTNIGDYFYMVTIRISFKFMCFAYFYFLNLDIEHIIFLNFTFQDKNSIKNNQWLNNLPGFFFLFVCYFLYFMPSF